MATIYSQQLICYHCGEPCVSERIAINDKNFCCEGCKMVFQLLDKTGLCDYYTLNDRPGVSQRTGRRKDKFSFLEDPAIAGRLIAFSDERQTHVTFYLPQVHCSSCLYLLENLHNLDKGVVSARLDFAARTVSIVFEQGVISLRGVADLLAAIGYEPYISLNDLQQAKPRTDRSGIYRLGVAGFCWGNIMLLSFPEYLGLTAMDGALQSFFRWLSLLLSLPVLLYSAAPFYMAAWKGLRHRFLNIDAPIALAILVTFSRSAYEVISGTGSGFFDSMSGIVLFMLAGRFLQDRTYRQLSFERDYTSYFPIAVTIVRNGETLTRSLPDIRKEDNLLVHHQELIPADGILTRGQALIDYSFVTGESVPVVREVGELVYAGGRQTGSAIELHVVKEVAQSYLTQLWNRREDAPGGGPQEKGSSFVHALSRYFTWIVLTVAASAALYWRVHDPARVWSSVTAVLIVACPCALLLSSTFTNGNILRVLGRNRFYLRNAQVIENIAHTSHIVFDKTGTLTLSGTQDIRYEGAELNQAQTTAIAGLAAQSGHPLSRSLAAFLEKRSPGVPSKRPSGLPGYRELPGKGIEGAVDGMWVTIGSRAFVTGNSVHMPVNEESDTRVYVSCDGQLMGYFRFCNHYRDGIADCMKALPVSFRISVLSGDNDSEKARLEKLLGRKVTFLFGQAPEDKTAYIKKLQRQGEKTMMIGDGLNDAGALQQADTGIALSDDRNNFTPASDAILDGDRLRLLPQFIRFCRAEKKIVLTSFVVSILYNIVGLSIAVQGTLSPLAAAVLMPASSLSILLLTYGCSNLSAGSLGLSQKKTTRS